MVTRTGGGERGEAADFRHLPGTQGNFTLEYQNAKAGPRHDAQLETIAEDKQISAPDWTLRQVTKGNIST